MNRFCGTCGAERPSSEQRFCGSCGAPLDSPTPVVPERLTVAVPPSTGNRSRSWGVVLGAVAVVLALAVAGVVGWQVLAPAGGADTPEQAVEQLLTAAASQDPVGALAMVNPGEVAGVGDLYRSAYDRAEREGLTGGDRITDALDISLDGLEFDVDELGDSEARVVLTGGDYTVTFHPERLPDRLSFVADEYPDNKTWTGGIIDDLGGDLPDADPGNDRSEPFLDAVRVDGRWYVSLVGTYVDLATGVPSSSDFADSDARPPDYDAIDEVVEPVVAKLPEDVISNLAAAVSGEDADELLANFPADQVVALRPWARTVEDLVASEVASLDVAVDDVDVDVEDQGDLVRMTLNSGTLRSDYVTTDGDSGFLEARLDGRCLEASDEYDTSHGCLEGMALDLGVDEVTLMLRKVDGGYQLDPLATAVAYGQRIVDTAPASLVDDAVAEIRSQVTGQQGSAS